MLFETDATRDAMLRGLGGVPVSAPSGSFVGIFDLDYVGVGEVPVESVAPRLTARTSDVERLGVTIGLVISVAGVAYVVRSVQPDGLGMTVLVLEGP